MCPVYWAHFHLSLHPLPAERSSRASIEQGYGLENTQLSLLCDMPFMFKRMRRYEWYFIVQRAIGFYQFRILIRGTALILFDFCLCL